MYFGVNKTRHVLWNLFWTLLQFLLSVTLNKALLEINPQPYNIQGASVLQLSLEIVFLFSKFRFFEVANETKIVEKKIF